MSSLGGPVSLLCWKGSGPLKGREGGERSEMMEEEPGGVNSSGHTPFSFFGWLIKYYFSEAW